MSMRPTHKEKRNSKQAVQGRETVARPFWKQTQRDPMPLNFPRDGQLLLLLGLLVCTVYGLSTPRTVMLEDDGLFITAASTAGVAHPPGYPLFVALGWLASQVPFGTVAWRVHMLSGCMGALTAMCIAWILLRKTGNRPVAFLAPLLLSVSEHFWSQAIIADVYTTNTALLFLTLVFLQEAVANRKTELWMLAAGFYGLGLANHWPLLLLGSPILLPSALSAGRDFWKKAWYLLLIALATAGILYGWMVWRSQMNPVINFYGPIESWEHFRHYISRKGYSPSETSAATAVDKLLYMSYFVREALMQLSVIGGGIALWGLVTRFRNRWTFEVAGECCAFFGSSFFLILLLPLDYESFQIAIFRPYPLVAYAILALWFGYGLDGLAKELTQKTRRSPVLLYAGTALLLLGLTAWNGRLQYRPNDTFAADQAKVRLEMMDESAILITYSDEDTAPIAYLHFVENLRPDIRLLNGQGLVFGDRLFHPRRSQQEKDPARSVPGNQKAGLLSCYRNNVGEFGDEASWLFQAV